MLLSTLTGRFEWTLFMAQVCHTNAGNIASRLTADIYKANSIHRHSHKRDADPVVSASPASEAAGTWSVRCSFPAQLHHVENGTSSNALCISIDLFTRHQGTPAVFAASSCPPGQLSGPLQALELAVLLVYTGEWVVRCDPPGTWCSSIRFPILQFWI
mmetsp:Transcript_3991/g.25136  ORF Transcript_3991/g.25136 Transcript_3991/m.25136 type:complete len:158 (+) Transcript_3991:993-1466(+)